ncbi:MAG: hypothetical protein O2819_00620 [Planctomycetota bacterium]|nr:hypothetical protein [Planctomycetota bacterium]MDA1105451.1 hypothetical protein [Planctomycetota bacterium]
MFGPSPTPLDPSRDYGDALPVILRNPRADLESGFHTLRDLLATEGEQTKDMASIYGRAASGNATREEISRANSQMMDLFRLAGLGTFFAVVPGSMLLLPLAVLAAGKLGIRLLPDSWGARTRDQPPTKGG